MASDLVASLEQQKAEHEAGLRCTALAHAMDLHVSSVGGHTNGAEAVLASAQKFHAFLKGEQAS